MDVYRRYFRITSGPLLDEVKKIQAITDAAHKEYLKILNEIGAKPEYYFSGGKLIAVEFENEPDRLIYKKSYHCNGWYPKRNKAGKQILSKFESVHTKDMREALHSVGLPNCKTIFMGSACYSPTITVIPECPPVIYVAVPWYDEDPEKINKYKKERESGKEGNFNYDSLLWDPTEDMQPVKKWEMNQHIVEWNKSREDIGEMI